MASRFLYIVAVNLPIPPPKHPSRHPLHLGTGEGHSSGHSVAVLPSGKNQRSRPRTTLADAPRPANPLSGDLG